MSAVDTARDILRIASTAGLAKDVIDLLEIKARLLTDELAASHQKIAALVAERDALLGQVAHLKGEVARLEAQHKDSHAKPQRAQPGQFVQNDGLLWKRKGKGFESNPYCPECASHPVMTGFPPGEAEVWTCPVNHIFDFTSRPPGA